METTLGATGNAVTGTRTVVAEDLTMEIGEVAKIIAVDGKINQEMVKTVISHDKIEITETENGSTMNMMSRKQDRRRNKSHKAHPLFIYIFLGFALCCVLFRARIRAVETGMDLELDFNSKSTWYSTVSIT